MKKLKLSHSSASRYFPLFAQEKKRKEKERGSADIFFFLGTGTLGTEHIDLILLPLITELILPRRAESDESGGWDLRNGERQKHAVISCHVIVTVKRLWQL